MYSLPFHACTPFSTPRAPRRGFAASCVSHTDAEANGIFSTDICPSRFLVGASSEPQLSSMDFTFARFALNMAMASSRTEPEVMLKAGAPAFLVGMLSNPNELVRWK